METLSKHTRGWLVTALVAVAATAAGTVAWAQTQTPPVEQAGVTVPANVLSVGEIESRLTAQGIKVKEIEVRDLIAEVEGYDAQGREVDVVIDRRSGEMLSHKYDRD